MVKDRFQYELAIRGSATVNVAVVDAAQEASKR